MATPEASEPSNEQRFMDSIVKHLGLTADDANDLRVFYTISQTATPAMAELFKVGLQLKTMDVLRQQLQKIDDLKAQNQRLVESAAATITTNKAIMLEINTVSKAAVFQEGRIAFDNESLVGSMKDLLRVRTTSDLLINLLRPDSRLNSRDFRKGLGLGATYGKQYGRKKLRGTMKESLSNAARTLLTKMVGSSDVGVLFLLRIAHLRGFARAHQDLLNEDDDAPVVNNDDDDDENAGATAPLAKKRKRKGTDLWSAFEAELRAKNKEFGADYKAPGWVDYIAGFIADERKLFKNDTLTLLPAEYKAKANAAVPATPSPTTRNNSAGLLADIGATPTPTPLGFSTATAQAGTTFAEPSWAVFGSFGMGSTSGFNGV
ncbi:hypothetical protein MKEN_00408500 [Mycena kentingensis (nom. inval.)]|nr:hypothetical protein MKEN_00408500 [Mycena kentingensis (nom. inval.)]